jgi:hypothetical protein
VRVVALLRQLLEPLDGEAGRRERVEEVAQGEVDPPTRIRTPSGFPTPNAEPS